MSYVPAVVDDMKAEKESSSLRSSVLHPSTSDQSTPVVPGDERIAPSNRDTASNLYPVDDIDGSSEEIAVKFESLWHDAVQ